MRKLLSILCVCVLICVPSFSSPLAENYVEQALGIVSFGMDDVKDLFGLNGKETETTKVSKIVFGLIKDKLSIDLEKEVEQFGIFIVKNDEPQENSMKQQNITNGITSNGSFGSSMGASAPNPADSFDFVAYIAGDFNPKNIVTFVKKLIGSSEEGAPKLEPVELNGKKFQAFAANDFRIIFYKKNFLLFCRKTAVNLMKKNKITMTNAPKSVSDLIDRSKSFLYLGKEAALGGFGLAFMAAQSSGNNIQPIDGMENIENLSGYLKEGYIYIEAGFNDASSAKAMSENIEKYKNNFIEEKRKEYEATKKSMREVPIEKLPEEIDKLYSAAKNIDLLNSLNYSQKDSSIIISEPFDGYGKSMIGVAGVGIIAAMAIPNFKAARSSAREKSCFSNMRVLLGAVEMYNMDCETMMTSINQENMEELVKKGYLKSVPKGTEPECEYYSEGDISKDGKIGCKKHGLLKGW